MITHGLGHLAAPFYQIFTSPTRHWHPWVVHFPIVLLCGEAVLVLLFFLKPELEYLAYLCLRLSFWSLLIAALAGLHDSGLDLGDGNKIALGFQDRWKSGFHYSSSITVHTWLALLVITITFLRLLWRWRQGSQIRFGLRGVGFALLTLMGFWCMLAMGYVGGAISHD